MAKAKKKHRIDPDDSFHAAMSRLIAQNWQAVWTAMPTPETANDVETIHQIRVASRRLRAAMDVSTDLFPEKWYRRLHREAKAMTGAFGQVRDIDVQVGELQAIRERTVGNEQAAVDYLINRLQAQESDARASMDAYIDRIGTSPVRKEARKHFGKRQAR